MQLLLLHIKIMPPFKFFKIILYKCNSQTNHIAQLLYVRDAYCWILLPHKSSTTNLHSSVLVLLYRSSVILKDITAR